MSSKVEWVIKEKYTGPEFKEERTQYVNLVIPPDGDKQIANVLRSWKFTDFGIIFIPRHYCFIQHWSRQFEWPWLALNGEFQSGQLVLDAGGCGYSLVKYRIAKFGCRVVVGDLDEDKWNKEKDSIVYRQHSKGIDFECCDILQLPFSDNSFDRVVCCSVLEHISDPFRALKELYRVTRLGGRLLVTFDVASTRRYNHTIDLLTASLLLFDYELTVPELDDKVASYEFEETDPVPGEQEKVTVGCLCFYLDK